MTKILNFGSLNIDYVYQVEHFVRPGETLSSQSLQLFCGGKGLNQSVAAARAGAAVFHAGRIGKDGTMLAELLQGAGVDTTHVRVGDTMSGHAIIQVDSGGQNCILLHGGENRLVDETMADEVLADFGEGDILLLQNEISSVPAIMERARGRGLRIALNPSPADDRLASFPLESVSWFILNDLEGEALTGEQEPERIVSALLGRYPASAVVLTLGKQGVLYAKGTERLSHGIYAVPRVDTTGAGDTFTGYFLAGAAAGLPMEEVLRRASIASSLAVSRAGAAASIPELNEVLEANLTLV